MLHKEHIFVDFGDCTFFMAMVGGGGVPCLERGKVFKIIGNGGFVFQMQ